MPKIKGDKVIISFTLEERDIVAIRKAAEQALSGFAGGIIGQVAAEIFEKRQDKEGFRNRGSERKSPSLEDQVRDLREEVGELRELLRRTLKRD